jgi:predicted RNA binding protein YcfA (HicA-like mRNA interferase family)
MGKLEKLIQKFLNNPPETRFEDVRYLLEAFGYIEVRSKGSHHIFRNESGQKVVISKKGGQKVKGIYVKSIVELLDLATPELLEPTPDDETENISTENDE